MKILAFDVCFGACSACVVHWDGAEAATKAFEQDEMTRGHAEALIPMIDRVLATANTSMSEIDRFAVTNGPGTFAGVRVGVASARAFALATSKPVIAIGTLEAIAQTVMAEAKETTTAMLSDGTKPFAIVRDARRDQVYAQSFHMTVDGTVSAAKGPFVCAVAAVPELLATTPVCAFGSGASSVPWKGEKTPICDDADTEVSALSVARLAAIRDPGPLAVSPMYLRAPDAKPQTGFALQRQV